MDLNHNSDINNKDAILKVIIGMVFMFLSVASLYLINYRLEGIVQFIAVMFSGATFGMAKTLAFDGIRYFTSK